MHEGAAEGVRAAGEWQNMSKGWTCIQIPGLQCCRIAVGMIGAMCRGVKQCITQLWEAHKQDGLVMTSHHCRSIHILACVTERSPMLQDCCGNGGCNVWKRQATHHAAIQL